MNIKNLLEAAKNISTVYIGQCMFDELNLKVCEGATERELCVLEQTVGRLPESYKDFLMLTNGLMLFGSSDCSLFSIREILGLQKDAGFKEGIYPIGYILEDYIVIKSDEIPSGNYIYAGDACCRDEYFSLNCDFEAFLDRLFIANGNNYWRWQTPTEKFDFLD